MSDNQFHMKTPSARYQIAGLVGFIISGIFFLISGIQSDDLMVIFGCIAWMVACGIWLLPLLGFASE